MSHRYPDGHLKVDGQGYHLDFDFLCHPTSQVSFSVQASRHKSTLHMKSHRNPDPAIALQQQQQLYSAPSLQHTQYQPEDQHVQSTPYIDASSSDEKEPEPAPAPQSQPASQLAPTSPADRNMPMLKSPTSSHFEYNPLELDNIRSTLTRLEESIIFAMIERAQFSLNSTIYTADSPLAVPLSAVFTHPLSSELIAELNDASLHLHLMSNSHVAFMLYLLYSTEHLHATVRRYTSPDEHAFSPVLPSPILPPLQFPAILHERHEHINCNVSILHYYITIILPAICKQHDDGNHGSSAVADVSLLQLISKRIHYGKFVAEAKYRDAPHLFQHAITQRDTEKLRNLITKPDVEAAVLQRVYNKAASYGKGPNDVNCKIAPECIASIYEQLMEMNKLVQIQYLLTRLDQV